MNDSHQNALKQSLKDMIGIEYELSKELSLQLASEEVQRHTSLSDLLLLAAGESEERIADLKALLAQEGGSFGATVKGGVATVTGTFTGIFAKMHEPPLSGLVRDDLIALNIASIGYTMLLTLALAINHHGSTLLASRAIEELPPIIVPLTDFLPLLVGEELAQSAPLASPTAVQIASGMVRDAWNHS
jgi:hypothetical protein